MKNIFLIVIGLIIPAQFIYAQPQIVDCKVDSLTIEQKLILESFEEKVSAIESNMLKHTKSIKNIQHKLDNIDGVVIEIQDSISSVKGRLSSSYLSLEDRIENIKDDIRIHSETIQNRYDNVVIGAVCSGCILFLLLSLVYIINRRKFINRDRTITEIHRAQIKLQETSLMLDEKLLEVMDKQLRVQECSQNNQLEEDHSLALKVADEIIRIQTNLSRMETSVRGYKQLAASVRRIKDNFAAHGYEIVDMIGQPYNEGMKVIADFIQDENLKDGEQIITSIIKPQINYNGVMIQAAQITVSQNI